MADDRDCADEVRLAGERVALVPVTAGEAAAVRRIAQTPQVRSRWGDEDPLDDPSACKFAILLGGAVVGMVQYHEETEPGYRHAGLDIFVDPGHHGRGIGRDAIRTLARYLIRERGHHRLVIDPAADNEPAIRCYAAVGFRPVGIMRQYERDADGRGWHDGLLMDLLAGELD